MTSKINLLKLTFNIEVAILLLLTMVQCSLVIWDSYSALFVLLQLLLVKNADLAGIVRLKKKLNCKILLFLLVYL